jgi:hypothetical protein
MLSRNVLFCFVLYQCDFPVTGSEIHVLIYRLQGRHCTVSRCAGILKWIARHQKSNARLGGKGGSSLIVHVLVIVFYVLIDVILCTLNFIYDAMPLLKILMITVELFKHQCLRTVTVTYKPPPIIS